MFAKIIALIVSFGVLGCATLAVRQQRIEAAHDLTRSQARLAELDRNAMRLRAQLAGRLTPADIQKRADALGALMPLSMERYQEMVRREIEEIDLSETAVTVATPR